MGISSKSKLREILEDERAVAIIDEYIPVAGMKMKTLLKFPQVSLPKDKVEEIIARLDALDE